MVNMFKNEIDKKLVENLALRYGISHKQLNNFIVLLEEGNTIPFISRYRKDQVGDLESTELFKLEDEYAKLIKLRERKESIKKSMYGRGQLTKELEDKIESFTILKELEDFYDPFIPREDSLATIALNLGVGEAAQAIKEGDMTKFNSEVTRLEKETDLNSDEILTHALNIVEEDYGRSPELKNIARAFSKDAKIVAKEKKSKKAVEGRDYSNIVNSVEDIRKIPEHRVLAMFRGSKENHINLSLEIDDELIKDRIEKFVIKDKSDPFKDLKKKVLGYSYENYIKSLIESEIKKELFTKAEERAIEVFSKNLRNILMQKPLKNVRIIGIDPAYRTGCKTVVIDERGELLAKEVIFPLREERVEISKKVLIDFINRFKVGVISIGNGTASKETELFVSETLQENNLSDRVKFVVVSEAGASVYSASKEAKAEFGDLDIYYISAINIARRLQDPLSELVKIDPKSLGIGQYQHDVTQSKLKKALDRIITSCVNEVGVDVNTASVQLLSYVSGLNRRIAENIVEYRLSKGMIRSRKEIRDIKGIGDKTYEQSIGFLRVYSSECKYDRMFIHPENYEIAEQIEELDSKGLSVAEISKELEVSELLIEDILSNIKEPDFDVRNTGADIILNTKVLKFEDLSEGDILKGVVSNVVDFGAFIDLGIKESTLLHKSKISKSFIKDPSDVLRVGDIVEVMICKIDEERRRIGVTKVF